jgi:hypothetical protein
LFGWLFIAPWAIFYTPVFWWDVLWYVRLSVCLSGPCRQDRDRTVSSRIIQLGIIDHHHERKNPIVFQCQRSKGKVIALRSRRTVSSSIIELGVLDHHHERKNPIGFQGQRSKIKVVALLSRKTL